MQDPVSVAIVGPSAETDPWVEGDLEFLRAAFVRIGCRVVVYYGHWNVFHYSWFIIPGQG